LEQNADCLIALLRLVAEGKTRFHAVCAALVYL